MNVRRYIAARRDTPHGPEVLIRTRAVSWADWLRVLWTTLRFWRCPLEIGRMDWSTAWAVAKGLCDVEETK